MFVLAILLKTLLWGGLAVGAGLVVYGLLVSDGRGGEQQIEAMVIAMEGAVVLAVDLVLWLMNWLVPILAAFIARLIQG